MRKATALASIVALIALALLSAPSLASPVERERRLSDSYDASDLEALRIDVGIGEFELEGYSGDRVEIDVRIDCDDDGWGSGSCPDRAERVRLESRERDGRLELSLEGTGTWSQRGMEIEIHVRAPELLATTVDMGIGELTVDGMLGDLRLDLGIGEIDVRANEETVGSVRLDVGTGEASVRGHAIGRKTSAGLFVRELSWDDGNGDATIVIDLGIGEIDLRLS